MGWYHTDLKRRARIIWEEKLLVKRTIKRTSDLPCLLCKHNNADKTNSHIIPKFLCKDILGKKSEAYSMSSASMAKRPTIVQSMPKEDHILCSECETYFNVLETQISNGIYLDLWNPDESKNYSSTRLDTNKVLFTSITTSPKLFSLFIYSIIWRMFITSDNHFKHFKASPKLIELLRLSLVEYQGITWQDVRKKLVEINTPLTTSKYVIHTCEVVGDGTSNYLVPFPRYNPYFLFLNRLTIMISFGENDFQNAYTIGNNIVPSNEPIKVIKIAEKEWNGFKSMFTKKFIESTNKSLHATKEQAFDIQLFMNQRAKIKVPAGR